MGVFGPDALPDEALFDRTIDEAEDVLSTVIGLPWYEYLALPVAIADSMGRAEQVKPYRLAIERLKDRFSVATTSTPVNFKQRAQCVTDAQTLARAAREELLDADGKVKTTYAGAVKDELKENYDKAKKLFQIPWGLIIAGAIGYMIWEERK